MAAGMDLEILSGPDGGPMGDMGDMGWRQRGWERNRWGGYGGGYGGGGYNRYPQQHHHHHRRWAYAQPLMSGSSGKWFNWMAGPDGAPAGPPVEVAPPQHHGHGGHHGGGGHPDEIPGGWGDHMPLSFIQPEVPGVSQRGGRVQPLGFTQARFDNTTDSQITVTATPQRPVRGGRLVGTYSRIGMDAQGLLSLAAFVVGTDGQLLSDDPIGFDMISPNAFGVGVNFTPASVGNRMTAAITVSDLPGEGSAIPVALGLWGVTVG